MNVALLIGLGALAGRASQAPVVPISLVPEFVVVAPGSAVRIAVRISVPDGWHIGWKYPGQSGLPTTLEWRTPRSFQAGLTAWPFPERAETLATVSHIYRGDVVLVSSFDIARDAPSGPAALTAVFRWGLCREICIPQQQDVRTTLTVGATTEASPRWAALASTLGSSFPARPEDVGLAVRRTAEGIRVSRAHGDGGLPALTGELMFFPEDPNRAALAIVTAARPSPRGLLIRLPGYTGTALRGVLVANVAWSPGGSPALAIDLPRP